MGPLKLGPIPAGAPVDDPTAPISINEVTQGNDLRKLILMGI